MRGADLRRTGDQKLLQTQDSGLQKKDIPPEESVWTCRRGTRTCSPKKMLVYYASNMIYTISVSARSRTSTQRNAKLTSTMREIAFLPIMSVDLRACFRMGRRLGAWHPEGLLFVCHDVRAEGPLLLK